MVNAQYRLLESKWHTGRQLVVPGEEDVKRRMNHKSYF